MSAVWSDDRNLTTQPLQDEGSGELPARMNVEIDGKVSTEWTGQFTYKELGSEKWQFVVIGKNIKCIFSEV
jgi:hypothetical protein